jgi:hypothetical protein
MSKGRTDVEPRWPVLLALAVVVVLHFALPEVLSFGPSWVLGAAFAVLATLVSFFHSRGSEGKAYVAGLILFLGGVRRISCGGYASGKRQPELPRDVLLVAGSIKREM